MFFKSVFSMINPVNLCLEYSEYMTDLEIQSRRPSVQPSLVMIKLYDSTNLFITRVSVYVDVIVNYKQCWILVLHNWSWGSMSYDNLSIYYSSPAKILVETAIKLINSTQGLFVIYSLVDSYEKGECRRQLDPAAEFLVAPVKTAQPLSQVSTASTLQSILQHFSLIRLIPRPLIPIKQDNIYIYICIMKYYNIAWIYMRWYHKVLRLVL